MSDVCEHDTFEDPKLSRQAPGAVLDTQDRKDCVAVILFDHVSPQDSGRLTRASDIAAGSTSVCQKVIIFLTNLGSGADTSVTKRQSCENRGILCNVPDGSDLSFIMACFYKYSTGQEMCQPSFTRYRVCLPAHDTVAADPRLMGITGINLNVISRAPSGAARTNVPCVARSLLSVLMLRFSCLLLFFLDAIPLASFRRDEGLVTSSAMTFGSFARIFCPYVLMNLLPHLCLAGAYCTASLSLCHLHLRDVE